MRVAVLTVSDRASSGEYEDKTGPAVLALVHQHLSLSELQLFIEADDQAAIEARLHNFSDQQFDLVLTNGGTGLSPRDVTPEATLAVVQRVVPGIAEAMRAAGRQHTPFADLSRGVAGQYQNTLIVNLPGSPVGAVESLEAVIGILEHAVSTIRSGS